MEALTAPVSTAPALAPTAPKERIAILDSLRGFAILGILLMNIGSFGMAGNGHDPSLLEETGFNYYLWYFVHLFPDGTQRALFSMLFGAGIILFVSSAEKKTGGLAPADYFFRRQLWLLVFSLVDVFILLWYGDILLDYALFGMLLFTFRKLSPKALLIAAGICLFLMLARENRDFYKDKSVIARGEAVAAMNLSQDQLSPKQKDQLKAMTDFKERSSREKKLERRETSLRMVGSGSYEDLYEYRTDRYVNTLVYYVFYQCWDVLLFMLLGMAFFKMGILTGKAPVKVYWYMFAIGMGLGLLLSYLRLIPFIEYKFNAYDYTKHVSVEYYQLARVFRSLGLFAAIMLCYKYNLLSWLFKMLRPVGRMAFTNYLMQSLICGIIFYSVGFGLYGKLERYEVYYVVGAVWLFQILFSNIWLRYYRFGPLEWTWRSLTYWKKQPMKKETLTIMYTPQPVTV